MGNMVYLSTELKLLFRNHHNQLIDLGQATGFFWRENGIIFLITNWHNLSGRHQTTKVPLHKDAALPNVVEVPVLYHSKDFQGRVIRNRFHVELYSEDIPNWWEHPTFNERVDVVALPLSVPHESLASVLLNEADDFVPFVPHAGEDAFVLGYPRGMDGGPAMPIWKRASMASQPDFDVDDLPKIYIDTATREGMSGSPVLVRRSGIIRPMGLPPLDPSKMDGREIIGTVHDFLGVYSGRIGEDAWGVQLGIVWKKRVIHEIVEGRQRGRSI